MMIVGVHNLASKVIFSLFVCCQAFTSHTSRSKWTQSGQSIEDPILFSSQDRKSSEGICEIVDSIQEPKDRKAYPQQTPHSGRHFLPSHPKYRSGFAKLKNIFSHQKKRGRFTEGWYYRLTLPEDEISFAFIVSIEDPGLKSSSDIRLSCMQVIGPNDEYLVQGDRDDTLFWAWKNQQGLGCTFSFKPCDDLEESELRKLTALEKSEWYHRVESGFQILPRSLLGRIRGHDGTVGGILDNHDAERFSCDFDFTVEPICGWGGTLDSEQKSTAGWLASFPIFEPHWQITLADARASGFVVWKNKTYNFQDAPFYSEKNWGAALPKKWYWTQCNSFEGYEQLSVVAGGGIRKIPLGKEEALGMVSCHYNGTLYEAVPWMGGMDWDVATWGYWKLHGNSTFGDKPFEIEVIYKVDTERHPGLVFRAPTPDEGLVRFCRDTFEAETTLTLWELEWDKERASYVRKPGAPLVDGARSKQGGAEVGGGPWWDEWKGEARVKRPIQALLRLPTRITRIKRRVRRLARRNRKPM